jgi:hypothetical protein
MKYLGNYRDWIQPGLLDRILSTQGDPTLLNQPLTWRGNPNHEAWYKEFCSAGYDKRNFYSNMYNEKTEDIKDFTIVPPIPVEEGKNFNWWFIKFLPGSVACMHYDPHTKIQKTAERYWMAMMDYHPGHLFVYEGGGMMKNYKAGDLWKFDNADLMHGVTNLSMIPRVTFQFTTYYPNDIYIKPKFYIDHSLA